MSKYLDKYNMLQSRIKPEEEVVKMAVDTAQSKRGNVKTFGMKKGAAAFLTSKLAVAAIAVMCICITVPAVAGVIIYEVNKKTRTEQYVEAHNISSEYVQHPELSVTLEDAEVKVERYIKVDNDIIIDIKMKNTSNRPGEKYDYSVYFSGVNNERIDSYRMEPEYNAEENSVLLSYIIKDAPDSMELYPVTSQSRKIKEKDRCMVLDSSAAPVFVSENADISITVSAKDINRCIEKTPLESEYRIIPFKLIISDFGIMRQFDVKDLYEYYGENFEWPWTPVRIVIEYDNGTKYMFANIGELKNIPASEKKEITYEQYDLLAGFGGYSYAGDSEQTRPIYTQYQMAKKDLDVSRIKSVYIDGIEFNVK